MSTFVEKSTSGLAAGIDPCSSDNNYCIGFDFLCGFCDEDLSERIVGAIFFNNGSLNEKMEPNQHKIDCQCSECQLKFGGLGLILRGIETRPYEPDLLNQYPLEPPEQPYQPYYAPYQPQPEMYNMDFPQYEVPYQSADNLPTLLQEFEPSEPDPNQPSTSSGVYHQQKKHKVCDHCQKQFNHTGDFKKHLRKHTKEQPYKCLQCGKKFSHTSNLHRHERSHSAVRPFRCEICDKEFKRKDKLDSHMKSKSCRNKRQKS